MLAAMVMKDVQIRIEEIYVPTKRRAEIKPEVVEALAESILEDGQQTPVQVREDPEKNRYVLVTGLHRLEALKALGEETIDALIVSARQH